MRKLMYFSGSLSLPLMKRLPHTFIMIAAEALVREIYLKWYKAHSFVSLSPPPQKATYKDSVKAYHSRPCT